MSVSEVAALKQRIEAECEALRLAMYGPRVAASHEIIHHRYASLDQCAEKLIEQIGEQDGNTFVFETYSNLMI